MKMSKEEKIDSYKNELKDILNEMIVPDGRKNMDEHTLLWLSRNLGIKNNQNSKFHRAMSLIKLLLFEYK